MSLYVIGDRDTVLGFELLGARGVTVGNSEEAGEALQKALQDEEIILLFITREWADALRQRVDRLKMDSLQPIVMEIPGKTAAAPEKSLEELVQRAIGIKI